MTSFDRVNAVFVGGGPAGLAPLVWAARTGFLERLAADGLIVVERGETLGAGAIGQYAIGSDTLAETFLECLDGGVEPRLTALRTHPATLAVAAFRGGSVPLPVVGEFLEALGEALSEAIRSAGGLILTGTEAVCSRRHGDGWETKLRTVAGETESFDVRSRHLVLATGATQSLEALDTNPVAGMSLRPALAGKLLLSGEAIAAGGAAQITRRLAGLKSPKVAIVGGSHSALAVANLLLRQCSGINFGPGSITLLHRRPLRVFYPSAEAALAEGYTDFDPTDICPVSHRLYRLAGFRLEARELVMRALRIGGRVPEPRLRLHRLQGQAAEAEARDVLGEADLVIAALGYQPRALPLFEANGKRMQLASEGAIPGPMVDGMCRVLDSVCRPIPRLWGIGLAAGFIPSGSLGGEPSFRGQTNGIWLWQNGAGAMIANALLHETADYVAA